MMLLGSRAVSLWAAAMAFAFVLFSPAIFNDADTYWHIEAGRWMIDNRAVLHIDPFSYTFAGHPWQTHEWLAEVVMAFAFVGLGWSGVALLFAAAFALAGGLLCRHLARTLSGASLLATLVLSLACAAGGLLARPHLLALPLLVIWTANLICAREGGRGPSWSLLPVMVLWANLHASFMIGLFLIVPFAAEAVWEASAKEARRWAVFGFGALAAALLTPYGLEGLAFPFKLMAIPQLAAIGEWQPANLHGLQPIVLAAGAALFVLLSRGAKIKPLRLCVLLGLFYFALLHTRHQMLLAVIAPLLLAGPLTAVLNCRPNPDGTFRAALAVFVLAMAGMIGARLYWPVQRTDGATTPAAALARVPARIVRLPVLNDYAFGGYLIFNDVRPFIDSRAELYGEDFLALYGNIVRPDKAALETALSRYRVHWTILSPSNPATAAMDGLSGWHRLYADRFAVIHIRNEGR
jgi:hypothetical protein